MIVKSQAKCLLCVRKAIEGKYCKYHYDALQSLKEHYEIWRSRYGELSWYDYLKRLKKNKYTGKWVKEVIEVELKKV